MNIWIPFICLALGAAINWKGLPARILKIIDIIVNTSLMVLMVVIGLNIGISETVLDNIGKIGLNCLLISLSAIGGSVCLTVLCEKTVMPLEQVRLQLRPEKELLISGQCSDKQESESVFSPLVFIMPGFIIAGILIGVLFFKGQAILWLDVALTVSLTFLYTGVGIGLASNKSVFTYIKRLGLRVLFLPAAVLAGCCAGGALCGLLLDVPMHSALISASGMGYYSLTGAFMTETYGIEAGTYGFIVNVIRDLLTVLLMPLLIKISKGSPIACGAAGCMDTMLIPVSRAVGAELGLVALLSGTIITFAVPVWLPLCAGLLG